MNKVILLGRLTKDVDVKQTQSNLAFASFSVAVNRQYKKEGEERQADFINCKAFSKQAEFVAKYFKKGDMIAIVGRIQTGSYEKDGQKIYTTDVMVEEVNFAGSKSNNAQTTTESKQEGFFPVDDGDSELPF